MINLVNLDRYFRTHMSTDSATSTFFRVFCKGREKAVLIKTLIYIDDAGRTRINAIGASFTAFTGYRYSSFHVRLPRSSSACFSEVSVAVPLSILEISSRLSLPFIS